MSAPTAHATNRVQFSIATPLQKAVADMLDEAKQPYEGFPSYYAWLVAQYERKRCARDCVIFLLDRGPVDELPPSDTY
jgi:hypothetical protein